MDPLFDPESLQVVLPIAPLNMHHMQKRSKSGIIKKKALLTVLDDLMNVDLSLVKPVSYKATLKFPVWLKAM